MRAFKIAWYLLGVIVYPVLGYSATRILWQTSVALAVITGTCYLAAALGEIRDLLKVIAS